MKKLLLASLSLMIVGWSFGQSVDFDTQIQPIFDANCTSCHTASHPTGLDLTSGNSYDLLVDHVSTNYSPALRVVSGDSTASVLYNKIANTGTYGGLMPQGGSQLSASDIHLIATWIQQLPVSIAEARQMEDGAQVTVHGVVTSPNFGTADATSEYTIQDPTAGIVIYTSAFDAGFALGDSITISGAISIYYGTYELIPAAPTDITVEATDVALPAFQSVTLEEFMNNYEDYQAELVSIDSVHIVGGSWPPKI